MAVFLQEAGALGTGPSSQAAATGKQGCDLGFHPFPLWPAPFSSCHPPREDPVWSSLAQPYPGVARWAPRSTELPRVAKWGRQTRGPWARRGLGAA